MNPSVARARSDIYPLRLPIGFSAYSMACSSVIAWPLAPAVPKYVFAPAPAISRSDLKVHDAQFGHIGYESLGDGKVVGVLKISGQRGAIGQRDTMMPCVKPPARSVRFRPHSRF